MAESARASRRDHSGSCFCITALAEPKARAVLQPYLELIAVLSLHTLRAGGTGLSQPQVVALHALTKQSQTVIVIM